jgi:AraC family transcriptional regulator
LAKIAAKLEQAIRFRVTNGTPGEARPRVLAQGLGWTVADVVCTCGPQDRSFEEQFANYTIAFVTAGSFQYRGPVGCELMSPGSLVLGNAGQYFECGHEHAAGDRCLAFWFTPEYFERLAIDAGARTLSFPALRLPPMRALSPLSARAQSALHDSELNETSALQETAWEEIAGKLATTAIRLAHRIDSSEKESFATPSAIARVTRAVRVIERQIDEPLTLEYLAARARLSSYHFLRLFRQLTGLTPHQYILRARLRESAVRVNSEPSKISDIALESGFGDVSNFNRAFRTEFGVSPRAFRSEA